MLAYVAKQRAQLERSFRTAIEDMKQSQKERKSRPQPQTAQPGQTAEPASAPASKPAEHNSGPHPLTPDSGAQDAPSVFCSTITPDSR